MFDDESAGSGMLQTGEARGGRRRRQENVKYLYTLQTQFVAQKKRKKIGAPHFPNNINNKTEETTKIFNSFQSIAHHAQKRSAEREDLRSMLTTPSKVPLLLLPP